nr:glycosyltransferase family 39 protein [Armatimonadota bacterium]
GWGLPSATHYFSYHPDETVVLRAAMGMNVFAGQLLPHYYDYGALQLYLVNFANSLVFVFGGVNIVIKDFATDWPQWARMYEIGRGLTVAMGVGTVWATFALGVRLWGRRVGLLAALTLALMPLHAQHSHWLTVDVPATFWAVLSLVWTARYATDDPRPLRAALWAGVFAGLAAATKYNLALALLPLMLASGFLRREPKCLVGGLLAATLAFLVACPGAVLEPNLFTAGLRFEAVHVNNHDDPTFKDTGNGFVFHIARNLDAGLGLPLLLLALTAAGYAAYRRTRGDGLMAAFGLPYYILIGLAAVRYARYAIPLLPILALWAGRLLADVSRLAAPMWRRAGLTVGVGVLLLTLCDALWLVGAMATTDPRDRALAWMQAHAPPPRRVGFAAMPWFGTPPLDPYFTLPKPGYWEHFSARGPWAIVYDNKDWDTELLRTARPEIVILSQYDWADARRLNAPAAAQYFSALRQNYHVAAHFEREGLNGRRQNLPHDMTYPSPAIDIYQRNTE